MAETDIRETTTAQISQTSTNYTVSSKIIDEGFVEWVNAKFPQYLGYYKQIPELKQAVDSLAMWTCGRGWTCEDRDRVTLERLKGWGEDSFDSIMQNMLVMKKVNGDSFAEIIRNDKGTLINIKPLNPSRMKIIINEQGLIERYEEMNLKGEPIQKYTIDKILHLSNNRIANENHGCSVVEACQWVIDARNEAMTDWRRILHLSSVRVIYVDVDKPSELSTLRTQWQTAIKNKDVILLPGKKGTDFEVADYIAPPLQPFLEWIRYLENFFYQAVGIPKIILGGSQEFTEASSKVGYLTFEQVYMTEQRILEQDLWNQLGIRIKFERPISLKDDMISSEAANTGQVGIQPNATQVGVGRQ